MLHVKGTSHTNKSGKQDKRVSKRKGIDAASAGGCRRGVNQDHYFIGKRAV